jgi:CheY-like chemotaxis protein
VLKKKDPNGTHFGTVKVKEFLEYVRTHPDLDIAFIDVEMKMDGITLTKKLKQMTKALNRPLAKLNRHIKITNTGKQRKAKSKTLSTTTVSF